jgi:hypothetical protein
MNSASKRACCMSGKCTVLGSEGMREGWRGGNNDDAATSEPVMDRSAADLYRGGARESRLAAAFVGEVQETRGLLPDHHLMARLKDGVVDPGAQHLVHAGENVLATNWIRPTKGK